jgi:hypothetical protein
MKKYEFNFCSAILNVINVVLCFTSAKQIDCILSDGYCVCTQWSVSFGIPFSLVSQSGTRIKKKQWDLQFVKFLIAY